VRRLLIGLLLGACASSSIALPAHTAAETYRACHDDTSIARTNTHGSPLNGTFGTANMTYNHENAYYYLDVQVTSACPYTHLVVQVTPNGIGNLAGSKCSTNWGPPCYPTARACIDACLAGEQPAWGFEYKSASGTILQPCAGGDGSGGNNCPQHPGAVIGTGAATVSWRYDNAKVGSDYRVRIANLYDDVIWESARLDVVACATCLP
jgi:hypothetical protein